jgi:4-amino-4-deoxy-L-arabinose transferase-like glycosyltransferase
MTETRWRVLLALILLVTLGRIAATHRVFSQTVDEPWHLMAGYDVLKHYDFTTDPHHPPLARVLIALPFLTDPEPVSDGMVSRGTILLVRDGRYEHNLVRARMPNLVFVAIAVIGVALWARHLFSPEAGLLAALLFASLPPVLAHGGFATTDMALTATFIVALYAFLLVLEEPTWPRTIALGVAVAAGLLAKFSFPVFFPVCALALIAVRRRFPLARLAVAALLAAAVTFLVIPPRDFVAGIASVAAQAVSPPKTILFDEVRQGGWWYYFPVALLFKTPIPFLILAMWSAATPVAAVLAPAAAGAAAKDSGNWRCRTPHLELALLAAAILGIAMTSDINLGIRHILPIYAPLAILAAVAIRVRWINAVLIAWLVIGSAFAHPDYLPWFNAFAGREPHRVLNDSNLDWGQDVLRLVRLARDERIPSITTSLASFAPLDRIGLPPRSELQALQPVRGWVAISEFNLAYGRSLDPEIRQWLDGLLAGRPYRRVGKSIRLYYIN